MRMASILVARFDDRGDRAEDLLVMRGQARLYVAQHRGRIPRARLVRNFAAAQKKRAFGDALLNLFVNAVTGFYADERAKLRVGGVRIAHLDGMHLGREGLLESLFQS